jgi:hypothetical protein
MWRRRRRRGCLHESKRRRRHGAWRRASTGTSSSTTRTNERRGALVFGDRFVAGRRRVAALVVAVSRVGLFRFGNVGPQRRGRGRTHDGFATRTSRCCARGLRSCCRRDIQIERTHRTPRGARTGVSSGGRGGRREARRLLARGRDNLAGVRVGVAGLENADHAAIAKRD